MKSSLRTWLPVLALLVAAGGGIAWWWLHGARNQAGAATHPQASSGHRAPEGSAEPVRVECVHPKKGGIPRNSSQPGSVLAFESAELFAKISGYLKELAVDIGDHVKRGQVLAVIDNPELVEDAARAAASLEQAKAVVEQSKARIKTAEASLKAAEAEVKKFKADIERYTAEREYDWKRLERYRGLLARNAVQQQVVDEEEDHYKAALAAEHSAEAQVSTAQAKVIAAQAMVDQTKADLVEAKANVDVAQSALDKANVFVSYTRIISPYTGVVTSRGYFRGDFIREADRGSGKPILTVARTDKVRVVTYVPDHDVPYVDVGDKAIITLDALPGEEFVGTVSRFANTEDVESRTMRTEIDLENPKNRLREGMYGLATLMLQEASDNLTIPTGCLTGKTGASEATVFVIRDGRVHQVPVKVGADDGLRVEVLANLNPDDNVVLNPSQVSEGVAAEPIESGQSASPRVTSAH